MGIVLVLNLIAITLACTASGHVIQGRADSSGPGNWCGSVATPEWLANAHSRAQGPHKKVIPRQTTLTVDTYFHVVANSTRVQDGYLNNQTLLDQLNGLNTDYAPSLISFNLKGITRTISPVWALSPNTSDHLAMKKALRRGTYSTLNIYFRTYVLDTPTPGRRVLGQCPFPLEPSRVPPGSNNFYNDGCMLLHSVVSATRKVTTHEVGHWFGLLHTFQGGCTGAGDEVDDTPAERTWSDECVLTRDSCPDQPGYDPVQNFMDYSPDWCRNHFTPGQSARMWTEWVLLRG